jgi:hypothetical protein
VVSLFYLREARHNPNANNAKPLEINSMLEFKIPDHLKILPNDSLEERNRKKRKLKHMKQGYKASIVGKEMEQKSTKWQEFNEKNMKYGKGHFQVKKNSNSIFTTPEGVNGRVGFMNSGQGMTSNHLPKERFDRIFSKGRNEDD